MLAAAGLRGPNPAPLETPSERWSLGRDFGFVTLLLDWAESPYIAAFFALSDLMIEIRQSSGRDRPGKKVALGLEFSGKKIALYRLFHDEQLNQLFERLIHKPLPRRSLFLNRKDPITRSTSRRGQHRPRVRAPARAVSVRQR
jgi:hypothetical protein